MKLSSAAVLAAVCGLAGLAAAKPVFDYPPIIDRKDIPAGVEVHEYNATVAALGNEDGLALSSRGVTEAVADGKLSRRSNCSGSSSCGLTSGSACTRASGGYADTTYYCGYTSRVSDHCTAIYRCDGSYDACLSGAFLKQQFTKIYTTVGCGTCGTYDIPNGAVNNCHVTYNYCGSCSNIG